MASASCWHLYCNSSSGSSTCLKFHKLYMKAYQCKNLMINFITGNPSCFNGLIQQIFYTEITVPYPFSKYTNKCINKLNSSFKFVSLLAYHLQFMLKIIVKDFTSRCLDLAASLFFANFCNLNVSSGDLAKISISSVVLSFAAFFNIPETFK